MRVKEELLQSSEQQVIRPQTAALINPWVRGAGWPEQKRWEVGKPDKRGLEHSGREERTLLRDTHHRQLPPL